MTRLTPATALRVILITVLGFVVASVAAVPQQTTAQPALPGSFEDGTVLVGFHTGTTDSQAMAIIQQVGAQRIKLIGRGIHVLRVPLGQVQATIAALRRYREVRYAEPNYFVHADAVPNDPSFGQLWGLLNTGQSVNGTTGTPGASIKADLAWAVTTGSSTVVVGIVDTGVDYNHPDLAPNIWSNPGGIGGCPAGTRGYNAITGSCDPMDDNGHGTHIAGTIGAVGNNSVGVVGVNWVVRIMPLKFLDADRNGTTANAISAIQFAIDAKAAGVNVRVLNNSWGNYPFSQAMLDTINLANANDMLFVASAGNEGRNTDNPPRYPSGYDAPNIIAVMNTDQNDAIEPFSNYGPASVDLSAPGVNILSTARGGGYEFREGTSHSAAHVSGAAALILSAGNRSVSQLKADILNNVDQIPGLAGTNVTGGRLNVCKAIAGCNNPPPDPTPTPVTTCPTGQFRAEYFNNPTVSGIPGATRCESAINYNWGPGGPGVGGLGVDNFSVRWTGQHAFAAGTYVFTATADDGIRVWVDGSLIVDAWRNQPPTTYTATRTLTAGDHEVRVEYYENEYGALAEVSWQAGGATPTPTAVSSCAVGQYRAEYFNNRTLNGTPSAVRCESAINYNFGAGGPGIGGLGADNFSVRWTGQHTFGAGGYTFTGTSDDGIRVWLDGTLIVDAWVNQPPTTYTATRVLTPGDHEVRVEYYEASGGAMVQVSWQAVAAPTATATVTPTATVTATATPALTCTTGQYRAEYFNNRTLSGSPSGSRCESSPINYNWGSAGPSGVGVGTDDFSARWVGQHTFAAGSYTFTATSDDGIRVWLDGALIVDAWVNQAPTTYTATRTVAAGEHEVKVEYYEAAGGAVVQVGWQAAAAPTATATVTPTATITPTATVTATATPVLTCTTGQYRAEYFNNRTLSGSPSGSRCESSPINYNWGTGGPTGVGVGTDDFSARWVGQHTFGAGSYTFTATSDDGIRVWLDGALIVDAWVNQAPTTYTATRTLTAGEHEVKVEYYEASGGATIQVSWQAVAAPTPTATPPPPCTTGQYRAEYFNNRTLSGGPSATRCESSPIDYTWGSGGPAGVGVGTDDFSVRWTGRHSFNAGSYTFTATADDGIRVWLDGVLIIDAWVLQGPTTYTATRTLTAGEHEIKVEYYEAGGGAVAQVSW